MSLRQSVDGLHNPLLRERLGPSPHRGEMG